MSNTARAEEIAMGDPAAADFSYDESAIPISRTVRVRSARLRAAARYLKGRARRRRWFAVGHGVAGGVDDLRERVRRALADGTLPAVDGHIFAGLSLKDTQCAVCGRDIRRQDYLFEVVDPPASAHRDCYFIWQRESAPYLKKPAGGL